jgi:hypothetical protein
MGQCIKYKKPSRPSNSKSNDNRSNIGMSRDNLNKIIMVNGASYLPTDKNFIPKDLITAVNNPSYTETNNRDDLPPYSYTNPIYIDNNSESKQTTHKETGKNQSQPNDSDMKPTYERRYSYSETTSL